MVTITVVVAGLAAPFPLLEGVEVHVYDAAGTAFVTSGTTDALGEVQFLLTDLTDYWVRFFKIGYSFPTKQSISVDAGAATNTFDVAGEDLTTHPPSTNPEFVRASGYLLNAAGSPVEGINLSFTLTGQPRVVGGMALLNSKVYTATDSTGWAEVDLARAATYDVFVSGMDDEVLRVKTPEDIDAVDMTDLLFPYVASVLFGDAALAMSVEDVVVSTAVVVLSSNVQTPVVLDDGTEYPASYYISLENSDPTVASAAINSSGDLTVIALSVGVTTITAVQKSDILVERYPEPSIVLTPLVVTVT